MGSLRFLIFVFLTAVAWGVYGPILHTGQVELGDGPGMLSRWKPFVCVGIAYFLIAVLYPLAMIPREGKGHWSAGGIIWSFAAGVGGALGALGIILAHLFGGKPVFVMPLVFGFAPVINTVVTAFMSRTLRQSSPVFYIGVLVVAIGAAGVMYFQPKHNTDPVKTVPQSEQPGDNLPSENQAVDPAGAKAGLQFPFMIASIALTALCWGSYGPILHKGQARMGGSRLRPFLMVGLAYLLMAVILPLVFWQLLPPDPGQVNFSGVVWSLLGGAAGAAGALGIIYAFNFGGKPVTVMPLVFGGAPVINTLVTTIADQSWDKLSIFFFMSMVLVIAGAVTVLTNAPQGHSPAPAAGHK